MFLVQTTCSNQSIGIFTHDHEGSIYASLSSLTCTCLAGGNKLTTSQWQVSHKYSSWRMASQKMTGCVAPLSLDLAAWSAKMSRPSLSRSSSPAAQHEINLVLGVPKFSRSKVKMITGWSQDFISKGFENPSVAPAALRRGSWVVHFPLSEIFRSCASSQGPSPSCRPRAL